MSLDPPPVQVPQQTRAGSATACRARSPQDPLTVLVAAVDAAIAALPPAARADALEPMLTDFAAAVSPVQGALAGAVHDPRGVFEVARGYLGNAFTHAVGGDVEATRAALIAARATLCHLGEAEDAAEGAEWRW
ncbi:hypothetical protein [Saccharothrix syringae]|uniref:Uncharacterized protein n=1 Tax=Saccharothrix syringae TaxID=103733 RepID=A0A5Q0H3D8_SACSY|nr:hypothetical protein [Saccharothrix syringae]QFZ20232.1 hypothetical protein EKG83_24970 [Saccharothrix syringae]